MYCNWLFIRLQSILICSIQAAYTPCNDRQTTHLFMPERHLFDATVDSHHFECSPAVFTRPTQPLMPQEPTQAVRQAPR